MNLLAVAANVLTLWPADERAQGLGASGRKLDIAAQLSEAGARMAGIMEGRSPEEKRWSLSDWLMLTGAADKGRGGTERWLHVELGLSLDDVVSR